MAKALSQLHPRARTTRAQRRQIQESEASDRALAAMMRVNVKTVAKWRRRASTDDAPMGPKRSPERSVNPAQEALVVADCRRWVFGRAPANLGPDWTNFRPRSTEAEPPQIRSPTDKLAPSCSGRVITGPIRMSESCLSRGLFGANSRPRIVTVGMG